MTSGRIFVSPAARSTPAQPLPEPAEAVYERRARAAAVARETSVTSVANGTPPTPRTSRTTGRSFETPATVPGARTVIATSAVAVAPAPSVTVTTTVRGPAAPNAAETSAPASVRPSPRLQA